MDVRIDDGLRIRALDGFERFAKPFLAYSFADNDYAPRNALAGVGGLAYRAGRLK